MSNKKKMKNTKPDIRLTALTPEQFEFEGNEAITTRNVEEGKEEKGEEEGGGGGRGKRGIQDHFQSMNLEKKSVLPEITCYVLSSHGNDRQRTSSVLVLFEPGSQFYFKGKLRIKVLRGSLRCLGYELDSTNKEFISVYCPKGFSLLNFKADIDRTISSQSKGLENDLDALKGLKPEVKNKIISSLSNKVVAVLQRLPDEQWILFLNSCLHPDDRSSSNTSMLFNRELIKFEPVFPDLERVLNVNVFLPDGSSKVRLYEENPEWEMAVQSIIYTLDKKEHPKLLSVGGKGVGKSTFNRYLCNRLLKATKGPVLFIDLDPGQAEFTAPGFISAVKVTGPIMGPNFCNSNRVPTHSFYIGDVNMVNCGWRYLTCIQSLLQCKDLDSSIPWIVNTMGFNKGLGVVLIADTIRMIRPTTLVNIYSRFSRKNYEFNFDPVYISNLNDFRWITKAKGKEDLRYNVLNFEAVPESHTAKDMRSNDLWGIPEPRKLRNMALLSVFGRFLISSRKREPSLNSEIPVKVLWDQIGIQVLHVDKVKSHQDVLSILNAGIVSLGVVDLDKYDNDKRKDFFKIIPSSVVVPSLGLGIVRSIDLDQKCIYVLTSIRDGRRLQNVNCLSVGAIFLPEGCLLHPSNVGKGNKDIPYVSKGDSDNNPLVKQWQRNYKPKSN